MAHHLQFINASVADPERHRSCKADYVGANPTGGPTIFQTDTRESANPPGLGPGDAEGSTRVSDHFTTGL